MSQQNPSSLARLSDDDLIASFRDTVVSEQEIEVDMLDHLIEMDRRKLSFQYSSLRSYLVEEFGIPEWLAERRIRIARLIKRIPAIRAMLVRGRLNTSLIELAVCCANREKLTEPDLAECLEAICGMSCAAAKRELATRYPNFRGLPHDRIVPLTAELSELRCVVDQETVELVVDVKGIHPGISMGELIKRMAREYRERNHPEPKANRAHARAEKKASRPGSEVLQELVATKPDSSEAKECQTEEIKSATLPRVPEEVAQKRFPSQSLEHQMVLAYGYQCSFIDSKTGKRCQSRHGLERDHIIPWADGGRTELSNVRFACSTHHARLSFLRFGESSRYFGPGPASQERAGASDAPP